MSGDSPELATRKNSREISRDNPVEVIFAGLAEVAIDKDVPNVLLGRGQKAERPAIMFGDDVKDGRVSRAHAQLTFGKTEEGKGSVTLKDLVSTNGTYIVEKVEDGKTTLRELKVNAEEPIALGTQFVVGYRRFTLTSNDEGEYSLKIMYDKDRIKPLANYGSRPKDKRIVRENRG